MRKLLACVLSVLVTVVPAVGGTTYHASGNPVHWHTPSEWVENNGSFPQSGDQIVINNGGKVLCEAGQTCVVGTSPSNQTTFAIACATATGSGILEVAGTLQYQGPVQQCIAQWVFDAGAIVQHDNSLNTAYHYRWQICPSGTCTSSSYLKSAGTGWGSGQYVTIGIAGGATAAGGFDGGAQATNEVKSGNWTPGSLTGLNAGGGQLDFSYTYLDHYGAEGLASGWAWATANLNTIANDRWRMDHVRATNVSGAVVDGSTNTSSVYVNNSNFQIYNTTDSMAFLFGYNQANTMSGNPYEIKNSAILGNVSFVYGFYKLTHNYIQSTAIVQNGTNYSIPLYIAAASTMSAADTPFLLTDNLIADNSLGTSGSVWPVGGLYRTATLETGHHTSGDCDMFRGSVGLIKYDIHVDGITNETWWSGNTQQCNQTRGALLIPSWNDTNSTAGAKVYMQNVVSVPKLSTNYSNTAGSPYWKAHSMLIADEMTAPANPANVQFVIRHVVDQTMASSTVGCGTGFAAYGIMDYEASSGAIGSINYIGSNYVYSDSRLGTAYQGRVVGYANSGTPTANNITTANYNGYYNIANSGASLYDYGATTCPGPGTYAAYANTVGTNDLSNVDAKLIDSTRNIVTWAAMPPRSISVDPISVQVQLLKYQTAAWDSAWEWSNNAITLDPQYSTTNPPACFPDCYYDHIMTGFTPNNPLHLGTDPNGENIGLNFTPVSIPLVARR